MAYVLFGCRIALATMFAIAVVAKLASRDAFHQFVAGLRSFGLPASRSLALAIIAAEIACYVTLVVLPPVGGAIAVVLLGGFAVGIAGVLRRGQIVRCRCFGAAKTPIGRSHLVRNLVLAAVGLPIAFVPASSLGVEIGSMLAALVGIGAGALIARWDDLMFLFTPLRSNP